MRLLNVNIGELELFQEGDIPTYAILSHTWGEEEVTFSDHQRLSQTELQKLRGCQKIISASSQALRDDLQYLWIDTCCIDKSSTAELSEAINSMFNWYHNAEKCYVYLSDVVAPNNLKGQLPPESLESSFSKSRWFTRGWTLQELIAPQALEFFGHPWTYLGSRLDLQATITRITGIPREVCFDPGSATQFSIAQRMSWAANRQTTLPEDTAYCLLGLFNVNMPLLYGEGTKAFIRLQHEIMKQATDLSLFAWENIGSAEVQIGSVLANHPSAFMRSGKIVSALEIPEGLCVMHRRSLMVRLPVLTLGPPWKMDTELHATALLSCHSTDRPNQVLGLSLTKLDLDQPWKRILGRHHGLARISKTEAEQAKFQTIELDMNVESNTGSRTNKYLEYHRIVDLWSLLWNGWCPSIRDEQPSLWNCAVERAMKDLKITRNASEFSVVALTISVSDIEHWNRTWTSTARKDLDIPRESTKSTNVQQQDSWKRAIRTSCITAASDKTTSALQVQQNFQKANANDGASRCVTEKSSAVVGVELLSSLDKGNISRDQKVSDDESSQKLSSNQKGAESCSGHPSWTDHLGAQHTEAAKACDREDDNEEDDEEDDEEEEMEEEDEEELCDVLSLASDVEFDDAGSTATFTSSTDGDMSLLDILVDILVDMITERSDIMSRLLGKCDGQDTEGSLSNEVEALSKPAEDTEPHRGRKRKADSDGFDGRQAMTGKRAHDLAGCGQQTFGSTEQE